MPLTIGKAARYNHFQTEHILLGNQTHTKMQAGQNSSLVVRWVLSPPEVFVRELSLSGLLPHLLLPSLTALPLQTLEFYLFVSSSLAKGDGVGGVGEKALFSVLLLVEDEEQKNSASRLKMKCPQEKTCPARITHFCIKTKGIITPTEALSIFTFSKYLFLLSQLGMGQCSKLEISYGKRTGREENHAHHTLDRVLFQKKVNVNFFSLFQERAIPSA